MPPRVCILTRQLFDINYCTQGRIQDLKKGGAKCTGAKRPGKIL